MTERPTETLRKRLKEECLLTQCAWMCDDIDAEIAHHLATLREAGEQIAAKDARIAELEGAMSRLLILKQHKDTKGKDAFYESEQPKAWKIAREVLTKESPDA